MTKGQQKTRFHYETGFFVVWKTTLCFFRLCRVQAFGEPRFFAGGSVLVQNAFLRRRVELDLRLTHRRRGIRVAGADGLRRLFGDGARLGFDQTIALAAARVLANFFLGGRCISQFQFLRIYNSDNCKRRCSAQFYLKRDKAQNSRRV